MHIDKLISYMEEHNLEGFYVCKPENVRYISGYTGDDSYLFISKRKKYFITDPRYTEQAEYECSGYEIVNWRVANNTMGKTLASLAENMNVDTIGFEADAISYLEYKEIMEYVKATMVPTTSVIDGFRMVKTEEEIECLRAACDIASRAFEKIIKDIKVGMTEKEIASRLAHYMVMEGADIKPYGQIVVSGARTSLLHGIPSSKAVEYGDFVLMDYGCQYKGYLSDMTRTIVVGKANKKQREVYEIARKMTLDAEAVLRPGVTGKEVYEASLQAVQDTEYFEYHYTGIGHGIGMFVHEYPRLGARSESILQENNVTTVEPGIYIPGWGGIRVEDQLLITEDGYENLISASNELIEI